MSGFGLHLVDEVALLPVPGFADDKGTVRGDQDLARHFRLGRLRRRDYRFVHCPGCSGGQSVLRFLQTENGRSIRVSEENQQPDKAQRSIREVGGEYDSARVAESGREADAVSAYGVELESLKPVDYLSHFGSYRIEHRVSGLGQEVQNAREPFATVVKARWPSLPRVLGDRIRKPRGTSERRRVQSELVDAADLPRTVTDEQVPLLILALDLGVTDCSEDARVVIDKPTHALDQARFFTSVE